MVAAMTVLAVVTAGGAYAYWSGAGNGSGAAATGTTQPITLSPATPTTQVYPGGKASVQLVASNPNNSSVRIESLTLRTSEGSGGLAVDAAHTTCGLLSLTFTGSTNGGAGWTVPARVGSTDGSLSITLPDSLAMSTSAADSCQGASFTVYLAADT